MPQLLLWADLRRPVRPSRSDNQPIRGRASRRFASHTIPMMSHGANVARRRPSTPVVLATDRRRVTSGVEAVSEWQPAGRGRACTTGSPIYAYEVLADRGRFQTSDAGARPRRWHRGTACGGTTRDRGSANEGSTPRLAPRIRASCDRGRRGARGVRGRRRSRPALPATTRRSTRSGTCSVPTGSSCRTR